MERIETARVVIMVFDCANQSEELAHWEMNLEGSLVNEAREFYRENPSEDEPELIARTAVHYFDMLGREGAFRVRRIPPGESDPRD